MLGKSVYNDKSEEIGKVEDVIVAPDGKISWAIIGDGGFLGLASKVVAIPMYHFKLKGDRFLLPGATKDALKALPAFHYATT